MFSLMLINKSLQCIFHEQPTVLGLELWAVPASDANIDSWVHMALNHFRATSSHSHVDVSDGAVSTGFFVVNSNSPSSTYRLAYRTFTWTHHICFAWHYAESRKLTISTRPPLLWHLSPSPSRFWKGQLEKNKEKVHKTEEASEEFFNVLKHIVGEVLHSVA